MNRKISLLIASMILMHCVVGAAYAEDAVQPTGNEIVNMSVLPGQTHDNLNSLFSEADTFSVSGNEVLMQNVILANIDGKINLTAKLTVNGSTIDINSNGNVYGFKGGPKDGQVFLIDFEDNNDVNFVQTRMDMDNGVSSLELILQLCSDETILNFSLEIDSLAANAIIAQADTSDKFKTLSLYNTANNVISPQISTLNVSASGDNTTESVTATTTDGNSEMSVATRSSVEYSTWTRFFNALRNSGYTYLDFYPIDNSVILNNGWNFVNNNSSSPYTVASYSSQNGIGEKIIYITRMDVRAQSYSSTSDIQLHMDEVMTLSYDEATEKISVIYYGIGPFIDNCKVGLSCPTGGKTVFNKQVVTTNLGSTPSTLRLFAVFLPKLGTIVSIWDALDLGVSTSGNDSYVRLYEQTYDLQMNKHNEVVRAVAVSTGGYRLDETGHSITIEGYLDAGYNGCTSWSYDFTATVI